MALAETVPPAGTEVIRMLARSRALQLRSGVDVHTPLLIPSLSSRGFDVQQDGLSEVATDFLVASDFFTEILLVSAYDLHHRFLPEVEALLGADHWDTPWAIPQLLVIDSGGYELAATGDGSEVRRGEREPLPFVRSDYDGILEMLPTDRDLMVVTWDHMPPDEKRPSYEAQVVAGLQLVQSQPHMLIDLLLKPLAKGGYHQSDGVVECAQLLRSVDVIGFTEQELGSTLHERAVTLAAIRRGLDEAGVEAPIHVFGVLDPLLVMLYFTAGGELFDGLTWLRYGIHNGLSIHREAASLLDGSHDSPEPVRRAGQQFRYLSALSELKTSMRSFVESGGDFATLGSHGLTVSRVHQAGIIGPSR